MSVRRFISECAVGALAFLFASCGESGRPADAPFTFAVFDVGQGLSQAGVADGRALVWDLGPPNGFAGWKAGYDNLGAPFIGAIAISHAEADHFGGASSLDSALQFSGRVIVSPYEDTAVLRAGFGSWSGRITFTVKSRGDTLGGLEGIRVECLWPPGDIDDTLPLPDLLRNHYSFVFRVTAGATSVLITSDIDSVAERLLSDLEGWNLSSDAIVVPHHGSAGSINSLFYGYCSPRMALISCAAVNSYGHPAPVLFDLFYRMGIEYRATFDSGSIIGESNGYYWTWR